MKPFAVLLSLVVAIPAFAFPTTKPSSAPTTRQSNAPPIKGYFLDVKFIDTGNGKTILVKMTNKSSGDLKYVRGHIIPRNGLGEEGEHLEFQNSIPWKAGDTKSMVLTCKPSGYGWFLTNFSTISVISQVERVAFANGTEFTPAVDSTPPVAVDQITQPPKDSWFEVKFRAMNGNTLLVDVTNKSTYDLTHAIGWIVPHNKFGLPVEQLYFKLDGDWPKGTTRQGVNLTCKPQTAKRLNNDLEATTFTTEASSVSFYNGVFQY